MQEQAEWKQKQNFTRNKIPENSYYQSPAKRRNLGGNERRTRGGIGDEGNVVNLLNIHQCRSCPVNYASRQRLNRCGEALKYREMPSLLLPFIVRTAWSP